MHGVRSTPCIDGSWVREPRRRSPGRGVQPRWLGARRRTKHGVSAPYVRRRERPNPEPWWSKLWRVRIPGEHRRATSAWPGEEVVAERASEGSKASKRACRPLTGEPSVGGKGTVRAARFRACRGDRPSDRGKPSSRLMRRGRLLGGARTAKSWLEQAKAVVKLLQALRRRQSDTNPQGSTRPARAGTAPRKGKALKGSSRDASSMKEGCEASVVTANGGVQKTPNEPRASQNRREGREP